MSGSPSGGATGGGVFESNNHEATIPCTSIFHSVVGTSEDPVVWNSTSSGAVILRDSESCEVIAKIEAVNPTCIAVAGNKVWVGRSNGKISIYDMTGMFLTVAHNNTDTQPITNILVLDDKVWTCASSKDIVEWEANKFCVRRILFGPHPGDLIETMCHNSKPGSQFQLFAGSRGYIRMWGTDGKWQYCTEGGSRSLVHCPAHQQLWSATDRGIIVYNSGHETDPFTVLRTLHQGNSIHQLLFLPSEGRVWAFGSDQVCTVFSTATLTPLQTLPTPLCSGRNAFVSHRKEITKVWCASDDGLHIRTWDSIAFSPSDPITSVGNDGVETIEQKATKQEIQHLKKKVKYLQSVGTLFRQRIGILFTEKFKQRDHGPVDVANFETVFRQALTDLTSANPDAAATLGAEVMGAGDLDSLPQPSNQLADRSVETLTMEKESLQLALNEALSNNARGSSSTTGLDVEKVAKYWKDKLKLSHDELADCKQEIERLSTMLHEMGPQKDIDIKRAHHICQVLKEKNALKEREMVLLEETDGLKKQLAQSEEKYIELKNSLGDYVWNNIQGGVGTPGGGISGAVSPGDGKSGSMFDMENDRSISKEKQYSVLVDQMKEDTEKLKQELVEAQRQLKRHQDQANECKIVMKQNALLKTRIQKMKESMQTQRIDTTTSHTEMQTNIEVLMGNINQLQNDLSSRDNAVQELSADKLKLMQDISRMNTILERYKTKVLNLEREQISRTKAEQISGREHKKETQTLCESLDNREGKIQHLQMNFVDISEQLQHQIQQVSRTNHELDLMSRENMSLKSKLQQLDVLLEERRQFTGLLGEVQGRMEMAIEELKSAQSTTELASELSNLEQRIGGLTALEGQLKQKDDLIAVREDEVQKLKLKLAMFERNVNNISAVFLQFPQSLDEMEVMIIENEEYRKMAGHNAELEERVKLRQLELQARKQQQQQQGVASAIRGGLAGSLDSATAALLARTAEDSDSDDESLLVPNNIINSTPVGGGGGGGGPPNTTPLSGLGLGF